MNFIDQETPQKLRGGYYTPADVADFLTRWALESRPRRILEPACGNGAFLAALGRTPIGGLETLVACEIDSAEAACAKRQAKALPDVAVQIVTTDFLRWHLDRDTSAEFDAVLGNPPFIRYQYLDKVLQSRAERIFERYDLPFTRHTNAWVPFVVASLAMLRPGGRLAMVVPAELLHVLHARPLRQFLLRHCSRIVVLDPEDLWFDGTMQGVVLLLAEKRDHEGQEAQVAILPIKNREMLTTPLAGVADFVCSSELNDKWMLGLLTHSERALWQALTANPHVRPFGEVARVDVGIVTGANKFFLVSDAVVAEFGLAPWARPMFGRSEHVRGVVYDAKSHRDNRKAGLPTNFLCFADGDLSESARRYIRAGKAEGLHRRYKCRIRSPWYEVPSVYSAPVGMLKRSHHFPRLILNTAGAYTTDTSYRIVPTAIRAADLVAGFVNSMTVLSAELEGRHYGGGVLELVPSEIERVRVPVGRLPGSVLRELDAAMRAGLPPEDVLAKQDAVVLAPLGIASADADALGGAWTRLRKRRQRSRE
jgi:adenine-specific DNA-methyltransferase